MAQALEKVEVCNILKEHPDLSFQEGPYQSRIVRQGDRSTLTVTHGTETLTVPLLWAFGRGQAGQTYVFEYNGAFYESRVSFFYALGALDLTMGASNTKPQTIVEAAGRHMSAMEARDCFGCHSAGGVSEGKLHMETLSPGVGCESCHGAVDKHADAVRAGDAAAAKLPRLGALSAEETAELCGRCHRTWSQIALNGPRGAGNVRFQPYRLANSKCFDEADDAASAARPATIRTRRCRPIWRATTPSAPPAIPRRCTPKSAPWQRRTAPDAICRRSNCRARMPASPIIRSASPAPAIRIRIEMRYD